MSDQLENIQSQNRLKICAVFGTCSLKDLKLVTFRL